MKRTILCALFLAACLIFGVQGNCNMAGRDLTVGKHYINCIEYTCHSDGHITTLTCPLYQCAEGKQIGYKNTDLSKPYPECCEGPICAD